MALDAQASVRPKHVILDWDSVVRASYRNPFRGDANEDSTNISRPRKKDSVCTTLFAKWSTRESPPSRNALKPWILCALRLPSMWLDRQCVPNFPVLCSSFEIHPSHRAFLTGSTSAAKAEFRRWQIGNQIMAAPALPMNSWE